MGRIRAGACLGVAISCGVLALSLADCASPTQIRVDVRAEQKLCENGRLHTGIAVTNRVDIDLAKLEYYEEGCEADNERVGILTITPSDAKDAFVGIRIVGAVNDKQADACGPDWGDCVLARRTVQFVPGKTVDITVILREKCIGRYCGGQLECNNGECVRQEQIQPDASVAPAKDGDPVPDAPIVFDSTPIPDVVPERIPDPPDACSLHCINPGGNTECNATAKTCKVNCPNDNACGDVKCTGDFACTVDCQRGGSCKNTVCANTGNCTVDCKAGNSCTNILCSSTGECNVTCTTPGACTNVNLDGGVGKVACKVTEGQTPACDNIHCFGPSCTRTCDPRGQACGPNSICDGGCNNWDDGGDGGDGG